jgi:hypothetical protein
MGLIAWFKALWSKAGAFIKKAWSLASPFIKEVLSHAAQSFLDSSKDLLIAAIKAVAEQGLPTTEAKQKAFYDYMAAAAKEEWTSLKDSETAFLRETALAIYKKATEATTA